MDPSELTTATLAATGLTGVIADRALPTHQTSALPLPSPGPVLIPDSQGSLVAAFDSFTGAPLGLPLLKSSLKQTFSPLTCPPDPTGLPGNEWIGDHQILLVWLLK